MGQVCYGVPEMVKIPSSAYSTPLHLTLIRSPSFHSFIVCLHHYEIVIDYEIEDNIITTVYIGIDSVIIIVCVIFLK